MFLILVTIFPVTKYRRRCIFAPMMERLKTLCTELTQKCDCELQEFNGEDDSTSTVAVESESRAFSIRI
ncbi:MAG: transposase [Pseudomonadota bacterium]|nr:transposase [Pseudomonadota bacterium]